MKIDAEVIIIATVGALLIFIVGLVSSWLAEYVLRTLRLEERYSQAYKYVFSHAWARHVVAATYSVSAILIYESEGIRKSSLFFLLECTLWTIVLLIWPLINKPKRRWTKDRWKNRVLETRWHFDQPPDDMG